MNDTIKTWLQKNYIFISCILAVVVGCFLLFSSITADNGASNVNTTGISNAQSELNTVRQQQSKAIEQNSNARESIANSIILNERASEAITHSEEYNQRTEQAIRTSESELAGAKDIIRDNTKLIDECRRILETAKEGNRQGEQSQKGTK